MTQVGRRSFVFLAEVIVTQWHSRVTPWLYVTSSPKVPPRSTRACGRAAAQFDGCEVAEAAWRVLRWPNDARRRAVHLVHMYGRKLWCVHTVGSSSAGGMAVEITWRRKEPANVNECSLHMRDETSEKRCTCKMRALPEGRSLSYSSCRLCSLHCMVLHGCWLCSRETGVVSVCLPKGFRHDLRSLYASESSISVPCDCGQNR